MCCAFFLSRSMHASIDRRAPVSHPPASRWNSSLTLGSRRDAYVVRREDLRERLDLPVAKLLSSLEIRPEEAWKPPPSPAAIADAMRMKLAKARMRAAMRAWPGGAGNR